MPYNDAIEKIDLLSSLKYYEKNSQEYPLGYSQYNEDLGNCPNEELKFLMQELSIVDEYLDQIRKHVIDKEAERIRQITMEKIKKEKKETLETQLSSKLAANPSKYDEYINQYSPKQPMKNNFITGSGKENCDKKDLQNLLNKKLGLNTNSVKESKISNATTSASSSLFGR